MKKDEIRHALEERASAVLGQPVHIEGLGLALRPRPGLRLRGVRVPQGENVSAAAVVISPALHGLGDLLRARFDLHVDAPRRQGVAVGGLCAVAGIDAETAAASRIGEILLTNLTLATSRVALEDLSGSIRLDPERGTPHVLLQDADERLRVELSPAPHGCRFVAGGDGWRPPAAAFAALDGIRAEGTADRKGVRFDKLDARSFDGVVAGRGTLSWEPRPALDLNLELRHLELSRLLAELGVW